MAQLHRMVIQGIRSFGPDEKDKQAISFHAPLTLILGQNGCGKTTIIESLKFVLSGDLPSGSKLGHGFVHDPKLARRTEVLGKVQLGISDVKGKGLTATRCVQMTQKKTKMEFKTLDVSVSRDGPDGQKVQLSGRCADIETEVAAAMGVSKSVLNNVIFCHQEDAAWPLDEGKKLKERFDAIFETVKHNGCLNLLMGLRKAIKSEVTYLKGSLDHLSDKKEAASRLLNEIKDTERAMDVARDQLEKYEKKVQPIDERLEEIRSQEGVVVKLYSELEKLKTLIKSLIDQQNQLKNKIQNRYEGTVEDLKDELNNFQAVIRTKDAEYRDLTSRMDTIKKEDETLTESMSLVQKKIGTLESRQQMNQKCVKECNSLLEKLQRSLGLQDCTVTPETNVNTITENIRQVLRDKEDLVEQMQRDMEKEQQDLQDKVDGLRDVKVKKEQEIKTKQQLMDKNASNIRKIQSGIKEAERGANRLADIEKQLTEVRTTLESVSGEMNIEEQNEDIKRYEDDEHKVNQDLEKVFKEVQELQRHSETYTKVTLRQKEHQDKTAEFSRLKNKNSDALKHLLRSIPDSGLKTKFDDFLDEIVRTINNKTNELSKIQNEIAKLEVNKRHKKEQLGIKEKEVKDDEEKLYEYCEDRDLEEVIKSLNDEIQKQQSVKGELQSQEVLFEKYVNKLQEKDPCCPLCHRDFERQDEASTLIDELRSEVRNVPNRLKNNEENLQKNLKKYDKLLQLRNTYEHAKKIKEAEIPKLRKELKEVDSKLKLAREESENLQNDLLTPQTDEGMARAMQSDIIVMDKCQSELRNIDSEISKLKKNLPTKESTRTLDEAMKEQEKLRKEVSELRSTIKSSKDTLEFHKNKLQRLHEHKNTLVEEQLKIQAGTQQLQQMKQNLRELEDSVGDLEEQIQILQSDVTVANNEFENVRRALSEMKSEHRIQIKEKRDTINEWKRKFQEICKLNDGIKDFERRGISGELRVAQQDFADLERDRLQQRERLTEVTQRVDKLKSEISGQRVYQRELQDNLEMFEKRDEENKLTAEKIVLARKIGGCKYEELVAEKRKLENNRGLLTKEYQQSAGRMEELQKQLIRQRNESSQEMYRDAGKKYTQALRQKFVKEMAEYDLIKYQKAMEWAMTQFHQERMKAINEIIHDLWRSIYRGNDIDYIKIDANVRDIAGDVSKRKAYDYKVVQVKNDVEIDLRGRCSAGQKVLASLVIRMALAETLSSKCSILALDEPTTNLDRENIESLAEALAQVVNTRMVNKGFQLIIITHDEEFVTHMRQVTGLKYYHVVSRNDEGKSRITKHALDGRK